MLQRINNVMGRILIAGDESSWDFGFMESLQSQLNAGGTLSPRQEEVLQQVEGRWSDEALKSRANWDNDWDTDKEAKFHIALRYYRKTGYYNNIVHKYILHTGEIAGIPTEKEYNKLVNNKYAAAVIRNLEADKPFPVGGIAQFRNTMSIMRDFRGKPCVILKYGDVEDVKSHAKGAIPLQVLIVGTTEPIWAEVRDLKKAKKRK